MSSWWDKKLGTTQNQPQPNNSGTRFVAPGRQEIQPTQEQVDDPNVSVFEKAAMYGKGIAAKTQHDRCPNCGSGNFFSAGHTNGPNEGGYGPTVTTERGQVRATSRCFDCGHNTAGYDLTSG